MRIRATRVAAAFAVGLGACGRLTLEDTRTIEAPGSHHPTVAVSPDGALLVAWVAVEETGANVYLARAERGRAFGEASDFGRGRIIGSGRSPSIAAGPDFAAVTWSDGSAIHVRVAH